MITLSLLKQCTKNDRKAHYELYQASFACMYSVCKRYYHNDDDVKSVLNMVFLKVVVNLESFIAKEKPIETFNFWVTRIAINYIIDEFRKSKKYREAMQHTDDFSFVQTAESIVIDLKEDMQEVMSAVEKLPIISRTVFKMYTLDGYKHKEIAELMNITENTSKVHFHQAKLKLKEMLNNNKAASIVIMLLILLK